MFLWVELSRGEYEPATLMAAMSEIGVAVMPGDKCAAADDARAGRRHLRLTYVLDGGEYEEGCAKVRRLVDEPGGSVIYAVYSQRLDKNEDSNNSRFKSSLCAVPVDSFEKAAPAQ